MNNASSHQLSLQATAFGNLSITNPAGEEKIRLGNFFVRTVASTQTLGTTYKKSRGTITVPTAINSGDSLYSASYTGHDSLNYNIGAQLDVKATENFSVGNQGTSYLLSTTDDGGTVPSEKLLLDSSGVSVKAPLIVEDDFIYTKGNFEVYSTGSTLITDYTVADTPKQIQFTSVVDSFSTGFTITTAGITKGRATYNGTRRRLAHCGVTLSFTCDTNGTRLRFYLYKNGVKLMGSEIIMFYAQGANKFQSSAIHKFADLQTGDYLELWGEADDICEIIVEDMNFFGLMLPNTMP